MRETARVLAERASVAGEQPAGLKRCDLADMIVVYQLPLPCSRERLGHMVDVKATPSRRSPAIQFERKTLVIWQIGIRHAVETDRGMPGLPALGQVYQ